MDTSRRQFLAGSVGTAAALRVARADPQDGFRKFDPDARHLVAGMTVDFAVIGELPYAEMQVDRADLHLAAEDVAVVDRLKSAGIPVIVVLISGRPLVIDSILGKADAIVAAWLPGSEGSGVADVIFGDHKPTGKLSFTWPRGDSTSLARSDPGYKTLFEFGYGLQGRCSRLGSWAATVREFPWACGPPKVMKTLCEKSVGRRKRLPHVGPSGAGASACQPASSITSPTW